MADQIDLAFRITANSSGMAAGIAQAERSLDKVSKAARATSRDFREASKVVDAVKTPAEKYAQTVQRLDDLMSKGLLTQEVYSRAVEKADADLRDASGGMNAYEEAASKVENAIDRITSSVEKIGSAANTVIEAGQGFIELGLKVAKVGVIYSTFRAVTMKRFGTDSVLSLAFGFTKAIGVIKAAEYTLRAFGVEADGAAKFATRATVAFTAFKAATMAGFTTAGVKAYASQLDKTYGASTLVSAGLTKMGVSAATQAKWFATMVTVVEGGTGILTSAVTLSALAFAQWAATAYLVVKAMYAGKAAAEEMATSVRALGLEAAMAGKSFQDLHIQKLLDTGKSREDIQRLGLAIGTLDKKHFEELGEAMERSSKAAERSGTVFSSIGSTLGSPLLGFFAAVQDGAASVSNGFADLGSGLLSLLQPIGQVLRPFGTLIGTVAEAAMKLFGTFLSGVGFILRVAGAMAQLGLAIPIIGFNNFADSIRSGVGAAFEWLSSKIEYAQKALDVFFQKMSEMPIIGGAFASSKQGPAQPVAGGRVDLEAGQDVAAAELADAAKIEQEFLESISGALDQQQSALSESIDRAMQYGEVGFDAAAKYQNGLSSLNDQLERGAINETTYAREADKLRSAFDEQLDAVDAMAEAVEALAESRAKLAEQDMADDQFNASAVTRATDSYFEAISASEKFGAAGAAAAAEYEGGLTSLTQQLEDGRINAEVFANAAEKLNNKFKDQVAQIKAVSDAEKKRANDVERLQGRIDDAQGFQGENKKALAGKSDASLEVADVRSSEGMKMFMSLASGREDPAIAEYRKSHETMKSMLAELKALQAAPLEIAGAAGG